MNNQSRRRRNLHDEVLSIVTTILILDNDLGFCFWLGQALIGSHCKAFPATTIPEAVTLIAQFKLKIDFLILNPAVPGAMDFMKALRREQRQLRVAVMASDTSERRDESAEVVPVLERKV